MIIIFFLQLIRAKRGDAQASFQFVTTPEIYGEMLIDRVFTYGSQMMYNSRPSLAITSPIKSKMFYERNGLVYPTMKEYDEYSKIIFKHKNKNNGQWESHYIFRLDFHTLNSWILGLSNFNKIQEDKIKSPIDDLRIISRGCQTNLACELCNKLTVLSKAIFTETVCGLVSPTLNHILTHKEIENIFVSSH